MSKDFEKALAHLLGIEGGFSDDPADSGGATNWGITEAKARQWGYRGPMEDLPQELAVRIYRTDFWDKLNLDLVADVASYAIAYELFDTGVNAGTGTAARFLQRSLNGLNRRGKDYADIAVDGSIGRKETIPALAAFRAVRGEEGLGVLLNLLNCLQGARYLELAERREKDERFLYGWLKERVSVE